MHGIVSIITTVENSQFKSSIKDSLPKRNENKVIKNRGGDGETNDDFYVDGIVSLIK